MSVTADLNRRAPHNFSKDGRRFSKSNNAVKVTGVAVPWYIPLTDTPDVVGNGLPTLFNGTLVRTNSDPTAGGTYDASATAGSRFTSDLTDILDAGTADILLMPASEAAGDMFILGFDEDGGVPVSLNIALSTAGVGGTGTWKYLARNGTWTAFPEVVDESTGLTAGTSNYDVLWEIPDDWVPMVETEIDSVARYYLAFEVGTVYATNPVGSEVTAVTLAPGSISGSPQAPCTGVITHVQYKATAGGSDNDTILQIYNWTKGYRGIVTLESDVAQARVALSTPVYVERGDEVSIGAVQIEGSSELTAFDQLVLEIEL